MQGNRRSSTCGDAPPLAPSPDQLTLVDTSLPPSRIYPDPAVPREIADTRPRVGMLRPQHLLPTSQCSSMHRFRSFVFTLIPQYPREMADTRQRAGMLRSQYLLPTGQRSSMHRFRRLGLSLMGKHDAKHAYSVECTSILSTNRFMMCIVRCQDVLISQLITPLPPVKPSDVV